MPPDQLAAPLHFNYIDISARGPGKEQEYIFFQIVANILRRLEPSQYFRQVPTKSTRNSATPTAWNIRSGFGFSRGGLKKECLLVSQQFLPPNPRLQNIGHMHNRHLPHALRRFERSHHTFVQEILEKLSIHHLLRGAAYR